MSEHVRPCFNFFSKIVDQFLGEHCFLLILPVILLYLHCFLILPDSLSDDLHSFFYQEALSTGTCPSSQPSFLFLVLYTLSPIHACHLANLIMHLLNLLLKTFLSIINLLLFNELNCALLILSCLLQLCLVCCFAADTLALALRDYTLREVGN